MITLLCCLLIYDPKYCLLDGLTRRILINELLFFGLSITAFFVMIASVLTYIPYLFKYEFIPSRDLEIFQA